MWQRPPGWNPLGKLTVQFGSRLLLGARVARHLSLGLQMGDCEWVICSCRVWLGGRESLGGSPWDLSHRTLRTGWEGAAEAPTAELMEPCPGAWARRGEACWPGGPCMQSMWAARAPACQPSVPPQVSARLACPASPPFPPPVHTCCRMHHAFLSAHGSCSGAAPGP